MILALSLAAALGVTTIEGHAIDPFELDGAKARALVFVFVDPDCPVSNRYAPELNRLHASYAPRGITVYAVYSGRAAVPAIARAHGAAFDLRATALLDPAFALADRTGASRSAEAVAYRSSTVNHRRAGWQLVYRGRIDDRAVSLGIWRPAARSRDLADVLQRVDRGEELTSRTTQAVGCYLRPLS